jgi:hypothetical protein
MRRSPNPSRRRVLPAAIAILAVAALLLSVPVPTRASSPAARVAPQLSGGVAYTVTWNGGDVSSASSASSAISIDLSHTANLVYYYNVSLPGSTVTISDARLQMYYLGFAVSTRDQVLTNPVAGSGHIPLSWTPVSVAYLLEGVYRLTASFLAPNGTTMWSENFYVRGTAPLGILALLPIVLLIIIVYEVYGLVRSGRYAALGKPAPTSPPSAPPSEPPAQFMRGRNARDDQSTILGRTIVRPNNTTAAKQN